MHRIQDQDLKVNSQKWAFQFSKKCAVSDALRDELEQEAAIAILHAAKKFNGNGNFWAYAHMWASEAMKRHVNRLGGALSGYVHTKAAVCTPIVNDSENTPGGWIDTRESKATQEDDTFWSRLLATVDARTALMIEAKIAGASYEEIGDALGMSRESVRKILVAFAGAL